MGKRTRRSKKPPKGEKPSSGNANGFLDNPDLLGLYEAFAPHALLAGGSTDHNDASKDPASGKSGSDHTEHLRRIQQHFLAQQRQILAVAAGLQDDDSNAKLIEQFARMADPGTDCAQSESDGTPLEAQIPSMLAAWRSAAQQLSGLGPDGSNEGVSSSDFTASLDQTPDLFRNLMQLGSMGDVADTNHTISRLAGAMGDLRAVQERLYALGNEIASESMSLLRQRLAEKDRPPVNSTREFYDLWVDCSEAVYADHVQKEDYAVLFGELVNAAVEVRRHRDTVIELVSGLFGLPRKAYFESIEKELLNARRLEKAAQEERQAFREQIAALTLKVEALSDHDPKPKKPNGKRKGKKSRERSRARSKKG